MTEGKRTRAILCTTAFARAVTTSCVGVLLGLHLARLQIGGHALFVVLSSGLAGATGAAVLATFFGDRWGRRGTLIALALLSAIGAAIFAFVDHPAALGLAAFVGMLNAMGRDRGGALILEQSALASAVAPEARTRSIAWYTMLQDAGHAVGAGLAGVPALFASRATDLAPHRVAWIGCAAIAALAIPLYAGLGKSVETDRSARPPLSARSRGVIARLSGLFAIDALAGGLLTTALLSFFFFHRFGASETAVSLLFFGARILNAGSHLGAAWLAARIGLVRTMVFTHIPSSLLLLTVAFVPTFPIAAVLFLLREGLVEMDVPTRQSYVLAVVEPHERTFASGVTNLVRLAAWAVAPLIASALFDDRSLYLALVIGSTMKIAYDLALWLAFRRVAPPEEART